MKDVILATDVTLARPQPVLRNRTRTHPQSERFSMVCCFLAFAA
jgi:hypothetical protein